MDRVNLLPVDEVEVLVLVDNFVDVLLPSTEIAHRAPLPVDFWETEHLRAEHGYSLLVTVKAGDTRHAVLYDAGMGKDTALHNLDVLGVRPDDLRAILLSHGHADHHGGLEGMVRRLGRRRMPLVLHPDAWRTRRVVFPTGNELPLPPPSRADLESVGVELVEERGPSLLVDDLLLLTGQVERITGFEKGFPLQEVHTPAGWEPDPWIWDDQAVVVNVRGRGLVVLSSCSHSGVINILHHARRLTGIDDIHAMVGGLHLSGGIFEPIIPQTVAALVDLDPDVIIPGHCTGWVAEQSVAAALPDAYLKTCVGTRLMFTAA
jgi:7,8-dihydropterin-6-yl-methyl-4-(beta-D-ribofuranosyl)aminobenzene 5'-phosphate synthase